MKAMPKFKTVEGYFSALPPNTKKILLKMRNTIREAAPEAEELISYNMPSFRQEGMLVYYAAYKNHIGFYPVSSAIRKFKDDLKNFKTTKGTIQFPLEKPLPKVLIKKIVKFRVKENMEKKK